MFLFSPIVGPAEEIADSIGFTNIITVDQLRDRFPSLDMVDMGRRKAEKIHFEHDFEKIEGVLLLGEPVRRKKKFQKNSSNLPRWSLISSPDRHLV